MSYSCSKPMGVSFSHETYILSHRSCDFEGGDVCARMMQVKEDNFDWTIGNTDTGKYAASAAGMGSYYAYFDTTQYHYPGDSAKLRMATLQRTGENYMGVGP